MLYAAADATLRYYIRYDAASILQRLRGAITGGSCCYAMPLMLFAAIYVILRATYARVDGARARVATLMRSFHHHTTSYAYRRQPPLIDTFRPSPTPPTTHRLQMLFVD